MIDSSLVIWISNSTKHWKWKKSFWIQNSLHLCVCETSIIFQIFFENHFCGLKSRRTERKKVWLQRKWKKMLKVVESRNHREWMKNMNFAFTVFSCFFLYSTHFFSLFWAFNSNNKSEECFSEGCCRSFRKRLYFHNFFRTMWEWFGG